MQRDKAEVRESERTQRTTWFVLNGLRPQQKVLVDNIYSRLNKSYTKKTNYNNTISCIDCTPFRTRYTEYGQQQTFAPNQDWTLTYLTNISQNRVG